ncbi:hypothetical protein GCM10011369_36480 [Neiella marina]|uniref:Uncharacterized protein n=1 Tax=Neiella marina TaxID=508461 RepID=A0A8J2UAQ4_9GAMM|nr:hypothetical protein [Neiella marina]GGA91069.1 hypothetical protein GCM10011369_36480 [Neiella marina]
MNNAVRSVFLFVGINVFKNIALYVFCSAIPLIMFGCQDPDWDHTYFDGGLNAYVSIDVQCSWIVVFDSSVDMGKVADIGEYRLSVYQDGIKTVSYEPQFFELISLNGKGTEWTYGLKSVLLPKGNSTVSIQQVSVGKESKSGVSFLIKIQPKSNCP